MSDVVNILIGPTACGKGSTAQILARRFGVELVSLDSMKIYRGMDIGTGKPSPENLGDIKYHLIDIVDPWESYNVKQYVADAEAVIESARNSARRLLFVGGTALYYKGLTEGIFEGPPSNWALREELHSRAEKEGTASLYEELRLKDPVAAERIQPNDLRRIIRALEVFLHTGRPISSWQTQFGARREGWDFRVVLLDRERQNLYDRIDKRVDRMFEQGLIDEVERLYHAEKGMSREAAQAIGYKEIINYLEGDVDLDRAREQIKNNTHNLARHQMTWFRKFDVTRKIEIEPSSSIDEIAEVAANVFYPENGEG